MNTTDQFTTQEDIQPEVKTTAITLPQRAQVALGSAAYEITLRELVKDSASIQEIKNLDGRTECHSAYMKLKNSRSGITNASKVAREDATAFSKALIAEEKRLIDIVTPEETRLQTLRDDWDAAAEAERQAKIKAERERIAAIKVRIDAVKNLKFSMIGKSSAALDSEHKSLSISPEYDTFDEFAAEYKLVRDDVLFTLQNAIATTLAMEAESARIAQERAAMEIERAEMAAKMAQLKAEREALANAEKERQAAAEAVAAHEEQVRLMLTKTPADQFSVRSAVILREVAQVATPQAALQAEKSPVAAPAIAEKKPVAFRPMANDIIDLVAKRYSVNRDTARHWLNSIDFQTAEAA